MYRFITDRCNSTKRNHEGHFIICLTLELAIGHFRPIGDNTYGGYRPEMDDSTALRIFHFL